MNSCIPRTTLEAKIHRGFGDNQGNGENCCAWCDYCKGYHEEHIRVLMAITNWPCTRAQNYNREVLNRCLETPVSNLRMFKVAYRRARRLAPYWRQPGEADPHYLKRMVELHESRPKWDDMLIADGEVDLDRCKGLRLPKEMQRKADEIKRRHPVRKRRTASSRKPARGRNGDLVTR